MSKVSTTKSIKTSEVLPKGYDVIEEVITLLGRMESDRLSTQDALVKERERVQSLRDEIDAQAYKRMHDLPLAVQRGKALKHSTFNYSLHFEASYLLLTKFEVSTVKLWTSFSVHLWPKCEACAWAINQWEKNEDP